MENSVRNTFKKIFENNKDFEKCKAITVDLINSLSKVKSESETITGFIQHLITKIIRQTYQEFLMVLIYIK